MPQPRRIAVTFSVLAMIFAMLAQPHTAAGHAILTASHPAVGDSVTPGAVEITLHYNSHVDRGRSTMTLIRPDHSSERLGVEQSGPTDQLSAAVILDPGAYKVRWQVLATDGHITRGDISFTVATPGQAVSDRAARN